MSIQIENAIIGCIIGTAVGDAIGLPAECLTKQRASRLFPKLDKHHLFFGRGMASDDTEHTCMLAQALIASAGDAPSFAAAFARQLKIWILLLPGGAGKATALSCLKLLLGVRPEKSGVYSAGNGSAMRSALIGVCFGDDWEKMRELVRASTRVTHTDPKAEHGALAVALAAHMSANHAEVPCVSRTYYDLLTSLLGSEESELLDIVKNIVCSVESGQSTEEFCKSLGCGKGVKGYIYSTVPVVLHAWLRNPTDYRSAITEIIKCGGDTDTTAAILGGIIGAYTGKSGIPQEWVSGLMEWPRSVAWMEIVGERLSEVVSRGESQKPVHVSLPAIFIRNIFFLTIILWHGFRRLLPPY